MVFQMVALISGVYIHSIDMHTSHKLKPWFVQGVQHYNKTMVLECCFLVRNKYDLHQNVGPKSGYGQKNYV